jgi:hypothetical protein
MVGRGDVAAIQKLQYDAPEKLHSADANGWTGKSMFIAR